MREHGSGALRKWQTKLRNDANWEKRRKKRKLRKEKKRQKRNEEKRGKEKEKEEGKKRKDDED